MTSIPLITVELFIFGDFIYCNFKLRKTIRNEFYQKSSEGILQGNQIK